MRPKLFTHNYFVTILLVFFEWCTFSVLSVHRTLDEAKEARKNLVSQFLRKEEGAIKLVGGNTEYEGK